MAFPARAEYELLIYGLPQAYPEQIVSSTLRLYSTSALTARLEGEVLFAGGLELRVREFVDFKAAWNHRGGKGFPCPPPARTIVDFVVKLSPEKGTSP